MTDYIITGRPVGAPLTPSDPIITNLDAVGDPITVTLSPQIEADFEDAGVLDPA